MPDISTSEGSGRVLRKPGKAPPGRGLARRAATRVARAARHARGPARRAAALTSAATEHRPGWLGVIYGLGYISLARTVQTKHDVTGLLSSLGLYVLSVVLAAVTSRFIHRRTNREGIAPVAAERAPRICSALIGLGSVALGALPGSPPLPTAGEPWTTQWLPLGTALLLVACTVLGEFLHRRRRRAAEATTTGGSATPRQDHASVAAESGASDLPDCTNTP